MAFIPELILLASALMLFVICLGAEKSKVARNAALFGSILTIGACLISFNQSALMFDGAYLVDQFSQFLKLVFAVGFFLVILMDGGLQDIRQDVRPEYYLFLNLSVCGLVMLVSCIDLITLVVALQTAAFPLYLMVPMRRERNGHNTQMESAIKYIMFGVAANGVMLFGLSYLFGLTGSTSLPVMMDKLKGITYMPLVAMGLAFAFAGIFYKLAVFPFHFWTPDVYQGSSNETAGLIASLPKVGAAAILVRFASLAGADNQPMALLLTCLSIGSMFYGNLAAMVQTDLKRLLGFSGIAHAGYAIVGFVALDQNGFTSALYYVVGYMFMVLACFAVICKVSADGANLAIEDLAGLHRRSPLLAITLLVGVFGLAGMPPFAGFMGKFAMLKAALAKGHLTLVLIAVINSAIAIYYYLRIIRETFTREDKQLPTIQLDWATQLLCLATIIVTLALGIIPGPALEFLSASIAKM